MQILGISSFPEWSLDRISQLTRIRHRASEQSRVGVARSHELDRDLAPGFSSISREYSQGSAYHSFSSSFTWTNTRMQIPSYHSHISNLIHETSQFAAYFAAPIMKSVSHIYLSALSFALTNSQMFHNLQTRFTKTVRIKAGKLVAWPTTRHILAGHKAPVNCVVISPIDHLIASASDDRTIRLFDVNTGLEVGVLRGHSGAVTSIGFSPNGTLITSGSQDDTVRIWDIATRTAVGEPLNGHSGSVQSVAFSPDDTLIASGSTDHTLRIWDIETHTTAGKPLTRHADFTRSVAFSPDGTLITSGSIRDTIWLWDVRTRTTVGDPLEGHSDSVESVAFSPKGALVASGMSPQVLRSENH